MDFELRKHSRSDVDKAGDLLRRDDLDSNEEPDAWKITRDWRATHNVPLIEITEDLRVKSQTIKGKSNVSSRIKRIPAIRAKLRRMKNLRFSQMQDIGACRSILDSTQQVDRIVNLYSEYGNGHDLIHDDDYISSPRPTGYRSRHLVYSYVSKIQGSNVFNKMRIEIQLRSKLQHIWATAVEIVDVVENSELKLGHGSNKWQQFFKLISSVFALKEGINPASGTPSEFIELKKQLKEHCTEFNIIQRLQSYPTVINSLMERQSKNAMYWLITMDLKSERQDIREYNKAERDKAYENYFDTEDRIENERNSNKDVLLVSVESIDNLKLAYPNYYLDISGFLHELEKK